MSINGIGQHYNPSQVYGSGRTETTQRTGSTGATQCENIEVSETRARISFACSTPELADALNFTADERSEYIKATAEKLSSVTINLGKNSVMLDIYAVMEMIREMSQELRNALRDMRQLENQTIQQNIRQQAATQRKAAWCQMIGGAVVGVIQGVATVAGLAKQISGLSRQMQANEQMGVSMADKQMKMAQVGGNEKLATSQLNSVEGSVAKVLDKGDIQSVKNSISDISKGNLTEGQQLEAHKHMCDTVDGYRAQYEQCLTNANSEMRVDGKVTSNTQSELNQAAARYELARATQVAESSKMAGVKVGDHRKLESNLGNSLIEKSNQANAISKTSSSERSMAYGMMVQQLAMAFGQMGQALVQGISQIIQAEGTELQANEKMLEEQLDQIKDLFAQDLSVIQKAVELFQSVVSKETQSIDEIINALKA